MNHLELRRYRKKARGYTSIVAENRTDEGSNLIKSLDQGVPTTTEKKLIPDNYMQYKSNRLSNDILYTEENDGNSENQVRHYKASASIRPLSPRFPYVKEKTTPVTKFFL